MASVKSSQLLLLVLATTLTLLFSHSNGLTCTSQTFKTKYANCTDLPTLNATLHYTYDSSATPNPTLSIAFVAPPPNPNGWVAWALNPTSTGMVGSQALIAFNDKGSVVVKTYNITSYGPISESAILYDVVNKSGEYSSGLFKIFATLEVPVKSDNEISQVWQVGAEVKGGVPAKHAFFAANLGSTSTLSLTSGVAAAETAKGSGGAAAATPDSGSSPAAPARREGGNNNNSNDGGSLRVFWGFGGVLVALGVSIFGI